MKIDIRPPARADRPAWLAIWQAYQAFYKVELPPETTDATWMRIHEANEPVWAALAWTDGRAVGLAQWLYHRSTWSAADYCYLNDLFVAPEVRGGGIGRRLIEHVRDEARHVGCSQLYWLTHRTNAQAMRLYESVAENLGFVQYQTAIPGA